MLAMWARRTRPAGALARMSATRRGLATTSTLSRPAAETDLPPPRNPHGVQLLPRRLRPAVFPPGSSDFITEPDKSTLKISQDHLKAHGLSPDAASVLPEPDFPMLPPLVGLNLAEHFWRIGAASAQPWLGMAHILAEASFPSPDVFPSGLTDQAPAVNVSPDANATRPQWVKQPGWTRYEIQRDCAGNITHLAPGSPVPYPSAQDGPLVFDIETLSAASFPAVMAIAASDKAMYSWLSPWLFESDRPDIGPDNPYTPEERQDAMRLIPMGFEEMEPLNEGQSADQSRRQVARLIVGHNVGYDRSRVKDEYTLAPTPTRWLDTMSLHAATAGIANPQRQTWKKMTKNRLAKKQAAAKAKARETTEQDGSHDPPGEDLDQSYFHPSQQETVDLSDYHSTVDANWVDSMAASVNDFHDEDVLEQMAGRNWIDVASSNSLAEVAKLHCDITLPKEVRNMFMDAENKGVILDQLDELLRYCATDVWVTHQVFTKVWPAFSRDAFPHPATMAGVFQLGSTRLPVDREWEEYLRRAEEYYMRARTSLDEEMAALAEGTRLQYSKGMSSQQAQAWADEKRRCLTHAVEELKRRREHPDAEPQPMIPADAEQVSPPWSKDPWLKQLDWTPKKPRVPQQPKRKARMSGAWWKTHVPKWYRDLVLKAQATTDGTTPESEMPSTVSSLTNTSAATLAQLSWDGRAIHRLPSSSDPDRLWRYVPDSGSSGSDLGDPVPELAHVSNILTIATIKQLDAGRLGSLDLSGHGNQVLDALRSKDVSLAKYHLARLSHNLLESMKHPESEGLPLDTLPLSLSGLDWTLVAKPASKLPVSDATVEDTEGKQVAEQDDDPLKAEWWPKWYWDLAKDGKVKVSMRNRPAPLLMSMTWHGKPLYHSRQHGWVYRIGPDADGEGDDSSTSQAGPSARVSPVSFSNSADVALHVDQEQTGAEYFKVPHEDGAEANVGTPFGKSFLAAFETGVLTSANAPDTAKAALDLNSFCSYWISARQRILNQLVIWDGQDGVQLEPPPPLPAGLRPKSHEKDEVAGHIGMILPQVIQMGTVTRRAIEQTWLTASNAKKTRVGSELKAMVKSPPGWSIVGADVDSEELWICSVLGDAQFGHHGSTAIGWMTLEGTKALGTDLHSKTASILGTSRNDAKVFNYSRIYGAGVKHATQLLLKADPSMDPDEATNKANQLYKQTKGQRTPGNKFFNHRFWHGGSESFVFNKLESIAKLDRPRTPVLGCGVTTALSRTYLPSKTNSDGTVQEAFLPSRVNWVVQSSGVDYLHLLLVSMDHLCRTYGIEARFLLSFHDDVRYLVRDEDVPRATLALQIANLWTRSMFAYMLEMDDLPLGCAFFSQVDVDKVLRKEPGDPCVTPSHPNPVAPGSAMTIEQTIQATGADGLGKPILPPAGQPTAPGSAAGVQSPLADNAYAPYAATSKAQALMAPSYPSFIFTRPRHRADGIRGRSFLYAQGTDKRKEIAVLDRRIKQLDAATDKAQLDLDAQEGWKELAHELSQSGGPGAPKRTKKAASGVQSKAKPASRAEAKPNFKLQSKRKAEP